MRWWWIVSVGVFGLAGCAGTGHAPHDGLPAPPEDTPLLEAPAAHRTWAEQRLPGKRPTVYRHARKGATTLVHARSERVTAQDPPVHRATLLHYLAANGVEGLRQRSPANAAEIARLLENH